MPSKELRNQRYDQGSDAQRYLYAHEESGLALMRIASKHHLNREPTYTKFALLVGDIVLGFYSSNQIISLLQKELNIDQSSAELVVPDILEFLKPLSDPSWISPEKEEIQELANKIVVEEISSEITQTEAVLETVSPIRTMAGDSTHKEQVYTSHQSAILNEGR